MKKDTPPQEWFSAKDIATIYSVTRQTAYNWMARSRVEAGVILRKIGATRRIHKGQFEQWIAQFNI